jgi:hypothetical protein
MKNIILYCFLFISLTSFSRTTWIQVELIFDSTVEVIDMQIISYEGDSVLVYLDLEDNVIKRYDCFYKPFGRLDIIKEENINSLEKGWNGQFPNTGQRVKLIRYKYGERILYCFAKQIGAFYKIWNPVDIPFANYIFNIPSKSIYIIDEYCTQLFPGRKSCEEFIMKEEDFDVQIEI